jgi:hypothetical protein
MDDSRGMLLLSKETSMNAAEKITRQRLTVLQLAEHWETSPPPVGNGVCTAASFTSLKGASKPMAWKD